MGVRIHDFTVYRVLLSIYDILYSTLAKFLFQQQIFEYLYIFQMA